MKYPEFKQVTVKDQSLDVEFTIEKDLLWCQGHFPRVAILPGVAQVAIVSELLKIYLKFDLEGKIKSISSLKFSSPIKAGSEVKAHITIDEIKSSVNFSLIDKSEPEYIYSSGKILFA